MAPCGRVRVPEEILLVKLQPSCTGDPSILKMLVPWDDRQRAAAGVEPAWAREMRNVFCGWNCTGLDHERVPDV